MAMVTSQQLTKYYDVYRDKEVTFTKDISRTLNLDPRQIYVKCGGGQWPCILNSTSFQQAKIIIGVKGGAYIQLSGNGQKDAVVNGSIRFCFTQSDNQPLAFSVMSKVTEIQPYMGSKDLVIVTMTFTQRPPDDLIEIIGTLLEANENAERMKEVKIVLSEDNKRKLGLMKEETLITVQNIPRHCILRELSFRSAKVVLLGISQFLSGKDTLLYIDFDDPRETLALKGKISATEAVQGRKDIVAATIVFEQSQALLSYEMHINSFLNAMRKAAPASSAVDKIAAEKAAQAEAIRKRREEIAAQNAQKAADEQAAKNAMNAQRQAQIQSAQSAEQPSPATLQNNQTATPTA